MQQRLAALDSVYSKIATIAYKYYKPVLSELIINPILGCAKVLIGCAQMVAGVAFSIFGLLVYPFSKTFGEKEVAIGLAGLWGGAFSGVVPGLVLMTPILGTLNIHSSKVAATSRWQADAESLDNWENKAACHIPDILTPTLCSQFVDVVNTHQNPETVEFPDWRYQNPGGWASDPTYFVNRVEKTVVIVHNSIAPEPSFFQGDWLERLRQTDGYGTRRSIHMPHFCFNACKWSKNIRNSYPGYAFVEIGTGFGDFLAKLNTYIFSSARVFLDRSEDIVTIHLS